LSMPRSGHQRANVLRCCEPYKLGKRRILLDLVIEYRCQRFTSLPGSNTAGVKTQIRLNQSRAWNVSLFCQHVRPVGLPPSPETHISK